MKQNLSRRDLLSRNGLLHLREAFLGPEASAKPSSLAPKPSGTVMIDPIYCLAKGGMVCTVCYERCPEPNAISIDGMRPVIHDEHCTACSICRDVCPAPVNAVRMFSEVQT